MNYKEATQKIRKYRELFSVVRLQPEAPIREKLQVRRECLNHFDKHGEIPMNYRVLESWWIVNNQMRKLAEAFQIMASVFRPYAKPEF